MLKWIVAGAAMLIAGVVKFNAHINRPPSLSDYLAFRCGPAETGFLSATDGYALWSAAHCWGCYAMAGGAAILAITFWTLASRHRRMRQPGN